MTFRFSGEVLKSSSHPDGLAGQRLTDYHNEPALKRGSIMPMRAIVVVAGLVRLRFQNSKTLLIAFSVP